MADSESFLEGNHLVEGNPPSFSELLFSNDDDDVGVADDMAHALGFSSIGKPPRMLRFGGYTYQNESEFVIFSEATKTTPQISVVACSDSSSASSGNNNRNSTVNVIGTISKSTRKRNGSSQEVKVKSTSTIAKTNLASQRTIKKTKTEKPRSTGNAKREKLGDRITALQQLVSPFGKTDTASVLHEAMGYIRFLQDQAKVLCSPYLQNLPERRENGGKESTKNLRSRGLCLVPVDCTVHEASSNGADFWSPATMGNNCSSFSSSKQ